VIYKCLCTFSQSSQRCSGTTDSPESAGEGMDSTLWSLALTPILVLLSYCDVSVIKTFVFYKQSKFGDVYVYELEAGHSIECITDADHSIAF